MNMNIIAMVIENHAPLDMESSNADDKAKNEYTYKPFFPISPSYKITPCSKEKAMEELVKNSSAQFDEETVKVFIKAI